MELHQKKCSNKQKPTGAGREQRPALSDVRATGEDPSTFASTPLPPFCNSLKSALGPTHTQSPLATQVLLVHGSFVLLSSEKKEMEKHDIQNGRPY